MGEESVPRHQQQPEMIDLHIAEIEDDRIPVEILTADSHFQPAHRLFSTDDTNRNGVTAFRVEHVDLSPLPVRSNHWSVGWSDLMMTMFVLFFIMFVYKSDDLEQLDEKHPEILAARTLQLPVQSRDLLPKSVPVTIQNRERILRSEPLLTPQQEKKIPEEKPPQPVILDARSDNPVRHPLKAPSYTAPQSPRRIPGSVGEIVEVVETDKPVRTVLPGEKKETSSLEKDAEPSFEEVYTAGKTLLQQNSLNGFAAIDIVPDKTVRLILTGDLLFPSAQAELTEKARTALGKLSGMLKGTAYMVNVEGHTDNRPIASSRFPSNWELSLARAGSVGRFLLDNMALDPKQIVISGYASYRPIASNETESGRTKNRRVEIILSRRKPQHTPD